MFFNKKSDLSKCFFNMVDVHSHIIPNLDNGAFSEVVSLQILSYYESLGVRKVIATPNIGTYYFNNTPSVIREEFNNLKNIYTGKIKLSLGAKYMLDCSYKDHLMFGELLPLFKNYVLVEMHKTDRLDDVIDLISRTIDEGYIVVLAHPENYRYLGHAEYVKLKDMGVLFQLNILSVSGCYGTNRRVRAEYLLNNSFYDFVGSNIHSFNNFSKAIRNVRISNSMVKSIEYLKSNDLLAEI